jgi:hypothetical protein
MRITTFDHVLLLSIGLLLVNLLCLVAMFAAPAIAVSYLFFGGSTALTVVWVRHGIRCRLFSTQVETIDDAAHASNTPILTP